MQVLGVDIGGTGVKAAVVDTEAGLLLSERWRVETPAGAAPDVLVGILRDFVVSQGWKGWIGIGFPGVIRRNTILTAANLNRSFVGFDLGAAMQSATGCRTHLLNDADAAAVAEMRWGAGAQEMGLVLVITVGTGIGTAFFYRGMLVPNSEFGHLVYQGKDAEKLISGLVREQKGLSWKAWGKRFGGYLRYLESLCWPDLIILGGGGAKKPEKFLPHLGTRAPVVMAAFRNRAGIVGAARAASDFFDSEQGTGKGTVAADIAPTGAPGSLPSSPGGLKVPKPRA